MYRYIDDMDIYIYIHDYGFYGFKFMDVTPLWFLRWYEVVIMNVVRIMSWNLLGCFGISGIYKPMLLELPSGYVTSLLLNMATEIVSFPSSKKCDFP